MLSFHVKFVQTDGRTDRQTDVEQYDNMLLIFRCGGIKIPLKNYMYLSLS